jgi:hypothetical protein
MYVQKSVNLFLMVSIALINTKNLGMERENAPYEAGSKRSLWIRVPCSSAKAGWNELRDIPVTIRPNMAKHIEQQICDRTKQEGNPLPEGGLRLIHHGKDLLKYDDDEALNKALFKDDSCNNDEIISVVLKWKPQQPQEAPKNQESFFEMVVSAIKNFE